MTLCNFTAPRSFLFLYHLQGNNHGKKWRSLPVALWSQWSWGAVEWAPDQPECVLSQSSTCLVGGAFLQPGLSRPGSFSSTDLFSQTWQCYFPGQKRFTGSWIIWHIWNSANSLTGKFSHPPTSVATRLGRDPGFRWGKWSTYLKMQGWEQLFSPRGSFVLQGTFSHIWRLFCCPSWSGMVLLAPSGWRSGMLLHILQSTGQPFTTRNYPGPKVTSAKVEKPQGWGQGHKLPWVTLPIYADRYSQAALPTAGYLIRVRYPFCNYSFTHSPQGCSGGRCFDGSHWELNLILDSSEQFLWLPDCHNHHYD